MAVRFFKCEKCGDIVVKAFVEGDQFGKNMVELEANTTDAATEKHVPVVAIADGIVHVQVGEIAHPMLEDHYIGMVVLETKKGVQIVNLAAGDEPRCDFAMLPGDKAVAVYEYCNLHGLWKAEL